MKKYFAFCLLAVAAAIAGCSKSDPILPGERTPVFASGEKVSVIGEIPDDILSKNFALIKTAEPQNKYEQNLDNEIFEVSADGAKRKIFAGFPTNEKINVPRTPVFYKNFVYAGLTSGELVKVNPRTRETVWVADIFRSTNMLGGGSILDIAAPIVIDDGRIFAGGLSGAFCEVETSTGNKKWCADIAVSAPFAIAGDLAFVPGADGNLHALDARNGKTYWIAKAKQAAEPQLETRDGKFFVIAGKERFDARNGQPD